MNPPTTYRFEWGTSTAYGQKAPVPDGAIGEGAEDVGVAQHLEGLTAGDTYHFRVVAQNANGIAVSADHTFVYLTTTAGLPDGRAYELVTPAFKDGALVGDVFFGVAPTVSADGRRVIVTSLQPFGGAEAGQGERSQEGDPYEFTRTSDGWVTTPLAPPASQVPTSTYWVGSAESGDALFTGASSLTLPDNIYVREADGSLSEVGPVSPASIGQSRVASATFASSEDFSHIVFQVANIPSDPDAWPFDSTVPEAAATLLYEYVGSGNAQPSLVGVSGGAGSTDLISVCATSLGSLGGFRHFGAVSADGGTVFFTARRCGSGSGVNAGVPLPATALYARIDGSRTVAISQRSPSDCTTVACQQSAPGAAEFQQASIDGSKVFFTSLQQLTDQASEDSSSGDSNVSCNATSGANGCNLYEYDFDAPAGENLTAISAGDTSGDGPRVQGVTAISADGSHAYFVAKGVLSTTANAQGQSAVAGADNLYVYERDAAYPSGRTAFIATLSASDEEADWEIDRYANVTPDGRFLVFTSHGDLTADDTSRTGTAQVFRYDAQTGSLVRISIGERGFDDDGNDAAGNAGLAQVNSPYRLDPTMSDDGSYVFFTSPAGLVPGALNNVPIPPNNEGENAYAQNVYEYHEGNVSLISDGRDTASEGHPTRGGIGPSATRLIGASTSGADVFFQTADSLVPQDTNTGMDIYDARICTQAEPCTPPPPAEAACEGEACLGAAGGGLALGAPQSASFAGAGNIVSSPSTAGTSKVEKKKTTKSKKKKKTGKAKKKRTIKRKTRKQVGGSGRKGAKSTTGRK